MSVSKDTVMLKPDSRKILIAMAEAEMEPTDLAQAAGILRNIVFICGIGDTGQILNIAKYLWSIYNMLSRTAGR